MNDRSYENFTTGQQLYAVIEFCSDPETLWGKLESGHWDWLGVHPKSKFVLGRPRTQRLEARAVATAQRPGADGRFRIEIKAPRDPGASASWFNTAEEARANYEALLAEKKGGNATSSGLWRIRLVIDNELEAQELVVQLHANYL